MPRSTERRGEKSSKRPSQSRDSSQPTRAKDASGGSRSGSSSGRRRARTKSSPRFWLLTVMALTGSLLFFAAVTFTVMIESDESRHTSGRGASQLKGEALTARAARHWATSGNRSVAAGIVARPVVAISVAHPAIAVSAALPTSASSAAPPVSSAPRARRTEAHPPRPPQPSPLASVPPSPSPAPASPARASPAPVGLHGRVLSDAAECAQPPSDSAAIDVTLVTQASAERLWMVPHICARWGGRMVIVTLQRSGEEAVEWPALELSGASVRRGGNVSSSPSGCALTRLALRSPRDEGPAAAEAGGAKSSSAGAYPINWLRNEGIRCVATSHYLVVDVDFWPSVELLTALREQLHHWADDTALVVPNFQRSGHGCRNAEEAMACREAFDKGEIVMPTTFSALHSCLDAKDCVVFDGEFNPQGQASTDVKAWLQLAPGATRRVPCITSERYEPFVALRRSTTTPTFDERFTGYGKNKVQLVVHLRRAGYTFAVLGRGFVIHFPHQRSTAKHHWLHSNAHGRIDKLFLAFGREVAARYASETEHTPLCSDPAGRVQQHGASGGSKAKGAVSVQQRLNEERKRRQRTGPTLAGASRVAPATEMATATRELEMATATRELDDDG